MADVEFSIYRGFTLFCLQSCGMSPCVSTSLAPIRWNAFSIALRFAGR
jgi:hypothetical protein